MICAIACVDRNFGIGYNNDLLFHIKDDLKHFKELTNNQNVIMGRKTYESLPNGSLPNRNNIIITSQCKSDGFELLTLENKSSKKSKKKNVNSSILVRPLMCNMEYIKNLLSRPDMFTDENDNAFIIGGESIYKELLPFYERIYLTRVQETCKNVDRYFPNINYMSEWKLSSVGNTKEENGIKYQFCVYDKVKE